MKESKRLAIKLRLFRYLKTKGYEEEQVMADFYPSKIDGFGVLLGKHNSETYVKKYSNKLKMEGVGND